MKKLMFIAICAMAAIVSCKPKGQTAPADTVDSLSVVIDSIIEENDTTPLPMFLIGGDGKYMHMLYWTNIEEPQKTDDNAEYFDAWHKRWELQEMFRRNVVHYTNRIVGDKVTKIKFVDELLKDPDGNPPSIGEIHGREEIPSLCARFTFVNPKDNVPDDPSWGTVICTDSYLNTRKRLDIKSFTDYSDKASALPADIVRQMEKEYGMKAAVSKKHSTIGGRFIHGTIEFKGEYKDAPKDQYDADRKYALALELLIEGDNIYKLEQLGYYDETYGTTWNADADGYIPNDIVAAFEGPKGLELCYVHGAPESFCVGMIYLRDGKLINHQYEMYHSLIDEEIPVWKKDLAAMDKLYHADERGDKDVVLTKWAHCYIDYDNEWIWLRDAEGKNGAFFIRRDAKFTLMAIENPRLQPSRCEKDGICYLKLAGPAGGPSWQQEIHAFKAGKRLWTLHVLEIEGDVSECALNGKDISIEEGKDYLEKVPEGKEITAYFKERQ